MQATKVKFEFDDGIDWPNGNGWTPCTKAFADLTAQAAAIKAKPEYDDAAIDGFVPMDALTPDDYQAWNAIAAKLDQMQNEGQVGPGEAW